TPPSPRTRGEGVASGNASGVVLGRHVLAGIVLQEIRRDDRDDRGDRNVDRDRRAGFVGGEQRGGDQRRRAAGGDRGELVGDRRAAVAQPRREAFRDQRRLRPVLHVVREQREH